MVGDEPFIIGTGPAMNGNEMVLPGNHLASACKKDAIIGRLSEITGSLLYHAGSLLQR